MKNSHQTCNPENIWKKIKVIIDYKLKIVFAYFGKYKMNFEIKKLIICLFYIFCLSGCMFQIYETSKIYFSYETTTKLEYDNEVKISLPAITICGLKQFYIRPEYMRQIYGNRTPVDYTERLSYLNKLSIKN